jgi:hypothetical protein
MRNSILLFLIFLVSCESSDTSPDTKQTEITTIITEKYELIKASENKALLILFPGGGTTSKETKEEFKIVEDAIKNGISVLLMNFNRHLWIEKEDSEELKAEIEAVIKENNLNKEQVFIGGMSIGGTVAISLSAFLVESKATFNVKGVFVIDSPIDLYTLYESAQKDLARKDFSEERLQEPKFIVGYFEDMFGGGDSLLQNIQKVAPITTSKKNIENISTLKEIKLRLYTEPDTLWWQENRQTDFENTNASVLQKTNEILKENNWNQVELIQTKDKGYRANGERHPHSWSIVEVTNLITWILE